MGLVKVRTDEREKLSSRAITDLIRVMIVGGYRTKDNVVKIKRWAWSPALEMWHLLGRGDFTLKAGQEMLGVELPVGDIVYTAYVEDCGNGDHEFLCSNWAASFHEAAVRLIGQDDIMWTEGVETMEDATPFEGGLK